MKKRKDHNKLFLYGSLALTFIILSVSIFSVSKLIFSKSQTNSVNSMATSKMGLTSYDKQLAIKFMDSNNDGRCDICGMDVELCIQSGQIQCNMDPKSTIGVLGSQHIHADWKIYINGKALDEEFFKPLAEAHESAMKDPTVKTTSSFIHVHEATENSQEKVGDVLHTHATGVPLWIFFESISMKFDRDCLTLNTDEKFCNYGENKLEFYVNSKPNPEWEDYVFKNLDKILISYGNEADLTEQLNSITDFAKNH